MKRANYLSFFNGRAVRKLEQNKDKLQDELADVLYYVLLMCNDLKIDPKEALLKKLQKNAEKYPVEKSYGSNKKYTELHGGTNE